jgi:hypothetical protein
MAATPRDVNHHLTGKGKAIERETASIEDYDVTGSQLADLGAAKGSATELCDQRQWHHLQIAEAARPGL